MSDLHEQVAQPRIYPNTTFIYALVDPRTDYVRYVGKSNKPLVRLRFHLLPLELKKATHKAHWLRDLLFSGFKPIQIILEEVNRQDWVAAEKRWIAHYRSIPNYPKLTNSTEGGEGTDGYRFSDEQRKKLSVPKTWKTRLRLSVGQARRWANASQEKRNDMLANLRTPWPEEKRRKRSADARKAPRKPGTTSQYLNVVKLNNVGTKFWRAACVLNGKFKIIGLFYTEIEAAHARDRFVLKNIGEDVPLNFPISYYQADPIENFDNRKRQSKTPKNNTGGYKGIFRNGKNGWAASISYMGVRYRLGTHRTREDAARAYDRKAIELFGDFARTNFSCADYR